MKNYILLASAAMMVATVSCTVDLTPKGEAPASNEITFDAADLTDIRPGEVITATMVIPTGGKNILSEERGWKVDGDILLSAPYDGGLGKLVPVLTVKEEGGKSILRFYCTSAGEHTVTYYTRYNWKGLTDGSSYKDVEVRKTITAIEGDIYNSKWGDSIEKTKRVHNGITQNSSNKNVYNGSFKDGGLSILRSFTFSNNKLAQIEEYFYTTKSTETLYNIFLRWHKKIQENQRFTYDSEHSTRNNEPGKVVIAATDSKEAMAENEALRSGQLDVHTVYHKEDTDAAIDLWMTTDKDGKKIFNFSRTYTPSK